MKKCRYMIEAVLLYLLTGLFSLISVSAASKLGGTIARSIGPKLAASRKALRNLENALPDKSPAEYDAIIKGMWENLGRVVAEYPHLEEIASKRTTIVNSEIWEELKKSPYPTIFIAGHLANWEVNATTALIQLDAPMSLIYRAPNNPAADRLLDRYRSLKGKLRTIPKASGSMRDIIKSLKEGRHIGILIDQKYNEGIPAPFFGQLAMTSPAFVNLAQGYGAHILPCRCERLEDAHFRLTLHPPIPARDLKTGEKREAPDVIQEAHILLERWISERPAEWLWLHRRWDSARLNEIKEEDI